MTYSVACGLGTVCKSWVPLGMICYARLQLTRLLRATDRGCPRARQELNSSEAFQVRQAAPVPAELEGLVEVGTSVLIAVCTGLRVSKLIPLQWGDINFEELTMKIQRSCVEGEINETKTEASESVLPLDPDLGELLFTHKAQSVYVADSDFVFAGSTGKPRWPDSILQKQLKPAAAKAGIGKVGWHAFRHTYSTLLHAMGTKPAVQKELLRHADIQTTLNIYTQAVSKEKRRVASKVVKALWNKKSEE